MHDVYNADVCTEVRREKRRGRRKRKRMGQGWGEKSGDEKEEENRRGEIERRGEYNDKRKTMIKGEGKEGDTPMKEKVEEEEEDEEG